MEQNEKNINQNMETPTSTSTSEKSSDKVDRYRENHTRIAFDLPKELKAEIDRVTPKGAISNMARYFFEEYVNISKEVSVGDLLNAIINKKLVFAIKQDEQEQKD